MRSCTKMRAANDELVLKVTNDAVCFKFKIANVSKNEDGPE